MESRRITTSCPHSTNRLALWRTKSATLTCLSAGSSKVDEITSAFTLRSISVTSSGRSSISKIIIYTSGWLSAIALAISFSNIVLPVLGCATISPRWPKPIGANKSTTRHDRLSLCPLVKLNFLSGNNGFKWSKGTRSRTSLGLRPFIMFTFTNGKNFSPSLGGRIGPSTTSPVFSPNNLICDCETYISSGDDI